MVRGGRKRRSPRLTRILQLFSLRGGAQPEPFLDDTGRIVAGSISEKLRLDVNGTEQGMFIRSRSPELPVLLYLHGGLPEYFLTEHYASPLEDFFTVVWWEQRGSGMSYRRESARETITVAQIISDTFVVTDYLRRRFGKETIYLLGHSGGSFIGIQAAHQSPERYAAYIGMAQMVDQLQSEILAWNYMIDRFRDSGDARMVRRLQAAPVTVSSGTPKQYLAVRDRAMHRLGVGTTRTMRSVITGVFLSSLMSPQYTWAEKARLWQGKRAAGVSALWGEMISTDLSDAVRALAVPAFFLHGRHDYTCSFELARDFVAGLQAPAKGFYTFELSAHTPILEEPGRAATILREDVLTGSPSCADRR